MQSETKKEKRKKLLNMVEGYREPNYLKMVEGHEEYEKEFAYTLNYVNYVLDASSAKKEVEAYLSTKLSHIPDYEFAFIGQIAWFINNGIFLKDEVQSRFVQKLNEITKRYAPLDVKKPDNRPTLLKKRTEELISELEGIIDDALLSRDIIEPAKLIEKYGNIDTYKAISHFQKREASYDEIENEKERKIIKLCVSSILEELERGVRKVGTQKRKVRKERKISPDKMVRKLKYLKEDTENGLVSVKPEKIINSEILWVFNVKTRKLGRYVAKTSDGLMVKGSKILNFSEEESVSKTIRKPKEVLTELLDSGKVTQRKILDNIKAVENKLNGNINKDTILVKVF